jgi:flagellar basal body-associated protein FliL
MSSEVITVIPFLIVAALAILVIVLVSRRSRESFESDFARAEKADLEYFHEHPGCTLQEAHQNRDRVLKKYGRY